mgnify:CR=1 FL=1
MLRGYLRSKVLIHGAQGIVGVVGDERVEVDIEFIGLVVCLLRRTGDGGCRGIERRRWHAKDRVFSLKAQRVCKAKARDGAIGRVLGGVILVVVVKVAHNDVGGLRKHEDDQGDEDGDDGCACLRVFAIGHNAVAEDNHQHSGCQRKREEPEILEDGAHCFTHEVAGHLASHAKHVGNLVVDAKEVLHAAFGNDDDAKDEERCSYDDARDRFTGNDNRDKPEKRACCQTRCEDAQEAKAKKGAAGVCDAQEAFEEKEGGAQV